MSKNYMPLELGGEIRGLKFNIGTLKCLKDVTGVDPLQFKAESDLFGDILPYAEKVLHAALLSNCLSKKEEPDFSAADIAEWVNDLAVHQLTDVINHYNGIFAIPKPAVNGEVNADTQPVNV